jgi:hypothetical protein
MLYCNEKLMEKGQSLRQLATDPYASIAKAKMGSG